MVKISEAIMQKGSFLSIFMHTDGVDKLLMTFDFLGSVCDGVSLPMMMLVIGKFINTVGSAGITSSIDCASAQSFTHNVNKFVLIMCYISYAQCIVCFIEGYCWTRTAGRQASKLRALYLKAVMRQEVGYFDLHVTSTTDVIATVSSDSLVIQDAIAENVPVFLMNLSRFLGAYVAAFAMLWRPAIAGFAFVLLVVIPGLISGRALISIARKIREEYDKAGTIVEQSISFIKTVYSFVREKKTTAEYSVALQRTLKLGLQQGLVTGLAIGSNGIVFLIWSFMIYYGSKLVMHHNAKRGTVFAVCSILVNGGLQ